MKQKPDTMLWLDDHRGQYIPRDFANSFTDRDKHVANVRDENWTILENGPDYETNPHYWDAWLEVCDAAVVTDEHGVKYSLWQDGALWLVPEGMEWNDRTEGFEWPEDEDEVIEPEDQTQGDVLGIDDEREQP